MQCNLLNALVLFVVLGSVPAKTLLRVTSKCAAKLSLVLRPNKLHFLSKLRPSYPRVDSKSFPSSIATKLRQSQTVPPSSNKRASLSITPS